MANSIDQASTMSSADNSNLVQLNDADLMSLRQQTAQKLQEIEQELEVRRRRLFQTSDNDKKVSKSKVRVLSNACISRYARHLILPDFGVEKQLRLLNSSFLIVGCGGLGCPAAQYLASCGAGTLGLVDYDQVEESNLHRQVLHRQDAVGVNKAESIKRAVKGLNSSVNVQTHEVLLTSSNALAIIRDYDVILDCTDNVATRYLLNDACVLAGKPLVSGSALRFEGQLTVYNHQGGPTYRCLYPEPPPPETVTNCSDGGVVGVVPGVIGVLQALEAIKVSTGAGTVVSGRLLVFDGFSGDFRTVKLRPRRPESGQLTRLIDYKQFCGGAGAHDKDEPVKLVSDQDRISVEQLKQRIDGGSGDFVLVDVRSAPEMDICSIEGSVNVPFSTLGLSKGSQRLKEVSQGKNEVVFLCRRGNDSQRALDKTRELLKDVPRVVDVRGGLHAWTKRIDRDFPIY